MKRKLSIALILTPSAALAHPGHGPGILDGLSHTIGGWQSPAVLLAGGIWAGFIVLCALALLNGRGAQRGKASAPKPLQVLPSRWQGRPDDPR